MAEKENADYVNEKGETIFCLPLNVELFQSTNLHHRANNIKEKKKNVPMPYMRKGERAPKKVLKWVL